MSLVPWVPIRRIITCFGLMLGLPLVTRLRLMVWTAIGLLENLGVIAIAGIYNFFLEERSLYRPLFFILGITQELNSQ